MSTKLLLPSSFIVFLTCVPVALAQPTMPPSCAVTASSCTDFLVTWEAVDGAIGFEVFRDGAQIPVATLPGTATSYLDHPAADISHTYCVRLTGSVAPPCCSTGRFDGAAVRVAPRDWYQDAFPSNETISVTGFGPWDTTSAWVRTGLNLAQLSGSTSRQDLPGDTVVCEASGAGLRVDLVFRILPGPGNHVIVGNRASGLRRVPTSTTPAVANAASANFWESYLADNGAVGTLGDGTSGPGHPFGWDPNRWNSARCDTAETNLFPVEGRLANLPQLTPGRWASMYHESDPKYLTLGVAKNRCFLVNPAGALNSTNITCGAAPYPPAWTSNPATGRSPSEGGLAAGVTREFSQIIPDGQLTPGAHVQYFLRLSNESSPATPLAMTPDTIFVLPQAGCWQDGARWASFGVLPDRWKEPAFGTGGFGMASMLVIDADDGGGDELAWVSAADTIGLTVVARRGAHNGWMGSAPGADLNDPAQFRRAHLGQAGSCYDLYQVRGSRDTLTGNAGSIGSRLAPRCTGCPAQGRESRQGPTSAMLRNYRVVVLLSGNRNALVLGPATDRGQDDVSLLTEFMVLPGGSPQPRGVWVMGSGFGESESANHPTLMTQFFRASLRGGDYSFFSGSSSPSVPISVVIPPPAKDYGLRPNSLDIFTVQTPAPSGQANAYYENVGALGPYVASVFKPASGGASPYYSLVDGFDLRDVGSVGNTSTDGRKDYVRNTLLGAFGSLVFCPFPSPGVGPEELSSAFLSLLDNPATRGVVSVHLSLDVADRVTLAVYDLAGRRLEVLADGALTDGPHSFAWDLSDARGNRVSAGVYWVRATTASGIRAARAVVVLR